MYVIHPHYTGRDKGAMYDAESRLLVFWTVEQARDWLIASWDADPRRSAGEGRYYADRHVSYTPLADYLGGFGQDDYHGPFYPTLHVSPRPAA